MGIFQYKSAGLMVIRPCSCGGSLCIREAALIPRHFHRKGVSRWKRMVQYATAGYKAYSGSVRAVQEAYFNPLISLSLLSLFAVQLYSQKLVENFLNTLSNFYTLEMATLAFKPYTYKLTILCSKSIAIYYKPIAEQVSILNKLQHIILSGALLSTPWLVANDKGYKPGIRSIKWRCIGLQQ